MAAEKPRKAVINLMMKLLFLLIASVLVFALPRASSAQDAAQPMRMNIHHQINYIELPVTDVKATKKFYTHVFGWTYKKWSPLYFSFYGAGVSGGFNGEMNIAPPDSGALIILYSENLAITLDAVKGAGGRISKPVFAFPGGKRFHFIDPNGTELAVWSEEL